MDVRCRIELFGEVRVLREDRVIRHFRTRKAAHLLACLALPPGRSHTREMLVDRFWPDMEVEAGRDNLSTALSALRKALEPGSVPSGSVLVAERLSVRLNPAVVTTDVQECEDLLQQAAQTPDSRRRADLLGRAVGLYQAELVVDCYDDWLLQQQRRWAERHVDALLAWAQALEEAGDLERALEVAARAASADPLREQACAQRMRLYAEQGRLADARGCYQDYQLRLEEEAGASPSPALQHLLDTLRAAPSAAVLTRAVPAPGAEPSLRGMPLSALESAVALRFPPLPVALNRFFGRKAELQQLVEWLTPEDEEANDDAMMRLGDDAAEQGAGDPALPSSHHRFIPSSAPSSIVHRPASAGTRLVTITGPGGSGKSRLAIEAAGLTAAAYGGRVAFVPLESLDDPARIPGTLVRALGLSSSPDEDPLDSIATALGPAPCLLVLDNYEQLLARPGPADGREVLRQLLVAIPGLRCLVTSRQALAMEGETELRLYPMSTPSGAGIECESMALFLDRARAIDPTFGLTAENQDEVSALCDRLEGLPLAIEMAAAWTRVLPPRLVRERLEREPTELTARRQDTPLRHRSLRAALEWSYDLLSPELRRAFEAFSVFRGGWSLEAAEAVCGEDALEAVADLAERSLVVVEADAARYRYLEPVREYAAECLRERGGQEALERHVGYYLAQAEAIAGTSPFPARVGWRDLGLDYPNLHAALAWLSETGRGQELAHAVATLAGFWVHEGHHLQDGASWVDRALSLHAAPDAARAAALMTAGAVAYSLRRDDAGRERYTAALSLFDRLGDRQGSLAATLGLARNAASAGRPVEARRLAGECQAALGTLQEPPVAAEALMALVGVSAMIGDEEGKETALQECAHYGRRAGLRPLLAHALYGLAEFARLRGDTHNAAALLQECVELDEAEGHRAGGALWALGILAESGGERAEAARWYRRYLRECLDAPSPAGVAEGLYGMAGRVLEQDEPDRSARLMGAALRQISLMDIQPRSGRRKDMDDFAGRLRERLGRDACEALVQDGWQMEPEAAIELALAHLKG